MDAETLRAHQGPMKEMYRQDPSRGVHTLRSVGSIGEDAIVCHVETDRGPLEAGLHPATGGDGSSACSGNMLLDALVGCAGVTLKAVSTALGIAVRSGVVTAEATLDFRGTLGVSRDVPVGFRDITLRFDLQTDATDEELATLLKLTERYCVVYQTLKHSPETSASISRA